MRSPLFIHGAIVCLLLLTGGETWQKIWSGMPPLLGIGLLFFWLRKDHLFFPWGILGAYGLLYDVVTGMPLGIHTIILLLWKAGFTLIQKTPKSFGQLLFSAGLMLGLYLLVLWGIHGAQRGTGMAVALQGALTILLLPALSMMLESLQKRR